MIFQRLTFGSATEKSLREGLQGEGKDTTLRASKVLEAELLSLGVKSFSLIVYQHKAKKDELLF